MNWIKKGLLFNSSGHAKWATQGAMIPCPVRVGIDRLRIFATFLDDKGIGRTGFVDVHTDDLFNIVDVSLKPIFDIGVPGAFDDNGILTCSVTLTKEGNYHFYYAGFELGTKIRYRLLTGLAITDDNFSLIKKISTPVLERSDSEMFFRGGPFCFYDQARDVYRMWYVGGSSWIKIGQTDKPIYNIKYIESEDGITWPSSGTTCQLVLQKDEYGFGRPYVLQHQGEYKMFFSVRKESVGYRLGYATSQDGIIWNRKDTALRGLDVSSIGWDSSMIEYSAVIEINDRLVMFYNGNDFGRSGFGIAECIE